MELQKRLSRKYKGKAYVKWVITIPPAIIKALGWKEGQEIEAEPASGKLVLKKKSE